MYYKLSCSMLTSHWSAKIATPSNIKRPKCLFIRYGLQCIPMIMRSVTPEIQSSQIDPWRLVMCQLRK